MLEAVNNSSPNTFELTQETKEVMQQPQEAETAQPKGFVPVIIGAVAAAAAVAGLLWMLWLRRKKKN